MICGIHFNKHCSCSIFRSSKKEVTVKYRERDINERSTFSWMVTYKYNESTEIKMLNAGKRERCQLITKRRKDLILIDISSCPIWHARCYYTEDATTFRKNDPCCIYITMVHSCSTVKDCSVLISTFVCGFVSVFIHSRI